LNFRDLVLSTGLLLSASSVFAQAEGYYDTVDKSSSQAMRDSLHEIIDDHQRFPYTSSAIDTWDILEIADENQDNENQIITIYRNASYAKQGGGNSFYNREHSWPKSYGFPNDNSSNYPYTDTHHLFLADDGYNSSRSNKPYNYCHASCAEKVTETNNGRGGVGGDYPGDSNWTEGSLAQGIWEVWPGRRGDVARAQMYMDVRYEGGTHGVTGVAEPDLILTDNLDLIDQSNTGENESVAYMGMLSVLLQWHAEDPVDEIERQHHEAAASFQGNRNPFVDHPEWVDCVFGGVCKVFQINAGLNDAWFNPATAGQGFFVSVFPNIGQIFLAWFTYDTERPPGDVQALLGEPGHRWLTAFGAYTDNKAVLDIEITQGGVFDSPEPKPTQDLDGTITLEFSGCNAGTVTYDIPSIGTQGVVPIERIALDNVPFCESIEAELEQTK
jgi:endonuclease I